MLLLIKASDEICCNKYGIKSVKTMQIFESKDERPLL